MDKELIIKSKKEIEDFIEVSEARPDKNGIINLKISDLIKYSTEIAEGLFENFFNFYPLIKNTFMEKFDESINNFNIVSTKNMNSTPIEHLTSDKEGKLLKFQGFIITSSDMITQTTYNYICSQCSRHYVSFKPMHECRFAKCRQILCSDDCVKTTKNFREFIFQEQIDGRLFCESIMMKLNLPKKEESNIINFPDLFGNKLEIVGVPRLVEAGIGTDKKPTFKTIIEIFGMKKLKDNVLLEERKKEVKKFIKKNKNDIIKLCAEHIGCNIYGYEWEKQALLLTVVGLDKNASSLAKRNPQMVTIMISDAGKGKSNLSKKFLNYVPNSIYITANTSKAGLVGGVEKSPNGTYMFTMGELPYSNNSFAILDEIDNLEKEQADVMLTVISEGILKVTKIKKFEMPVHINFIIQGNPKNSYFDPNVPFFSQITLTRPFLDRADFLIILHDPYDENNSDETYSFANAVLSDKETCREHPDQLIKDILFYIKNYVPNPVIDEISKKAIADCWVKLKDYRRNKVNNSHEDKEDLRPVGARSLVSIAKISLAVARFRMNKIVSKTDVDIAYKIFYESSIKNLVKDFGGFDSYSIQPVNVKGNITKPETKAHLVEWIKQKLSKQKDGMMDTQDLVVYIIEHFKFEESVVDDLIEKMKTSGTLTEPRRGFTKY